MQKKKSRIQRCADKKIYFIEDYYNSNCEILKNIKNKHLDVSLEIDEINKKIASFDNITYADVLLRVQDELDDRNVLCERLDKELKYFEHLSEIITKILALSESLYRLLNYKSVIKSIKNKELRQIKKGKDVDKNLTLIARRLWYACGQPSFT